MLPKCLVNHVLSFAPDHRDNFRPVLHEIGSMFESVTTSECIAALLYEHALRKHQILDLGARSGMTGYIDYIEQEELSSGTGIAQGMDYYGRPFFTLKVRVVLEDGKFYDTFSTFFQRYTDLHTLWQCCGHDGINLFETSGGMDCTQLSILVHLLRYGRRMLTNREKEITRFHFYRRNSDIQRLVVIPHKNAIN
jgi:hypothetical protein